MRNWGSSHAQITVERKDANGTKPDAKVYLHTETIVTDVAIVHPNAPSRTRSAAINRPGHSAKAMAKYKKDKYKPIAVALHGKMMPFCLETYGGYDAQALNLLKAIVKQTSSPILGPPRPYAMTKPTLMRLISASLQRENANVVIEWLHYNRAQGNTSALDLQPLPSWPSEPARDPRVHSSSSS